MKRGDGRVTIDEMPDHESRQVSAMTRGVHDLIQLMFAAALVAGLTDWLPRAEAQAPRAGRIPPPESLSLTTKDGVQVGITYYPSNAGTQAVPVILLHDFNETRAVFDPLARL